MVAKPLKTMKKQDRSEQPETDRVACCTCSNIGIWTVHLKQIEYILYSRFHFYYPVHRQAHGPSGTLDYPLESYLDDLNPSNHDDCNLQLIRTETCSNTNSADLSAPLASWFGKT